MKTDDCFDKDVRLQLVGTKRGLCMGNIEGISQSARYSPLKHTDVIVIVNNNYGNMHVL